MPKDNEPTEEQTDEIAAAIREMALKAREEMLSETILSLVPYLEPGEMEGVTFKNMEDELPESAIEKAKERMLRDFIFKLTKRSIAENS